MQQLPLTLLVNNVSPKLLHSNLSSGVTLNVQRGAEVIGALDRAEYPMVASLPSYESDKSKLRHQSLVMIVAGANDVSCHDVRVIGAGTISGNGSAFWYKRAKSGPKVCGEWQNMEIHNCSNVEVTGITLKDPANWNLHPIYSRDVYIHDMVISAPCHSPSTDGIDPDSSSNVLIERVNITSGDDHIAIKAGKDAAGRAFGMPSRNITVRGNWHGCGGGISIGSELSGGVEDVLVEDVLHAGPSSTGLQIKTAPSRGGHARNVRYRNISFGAVSSGFITIWQNDGSDPPAPRLTDIRNIHYEQLRRIPGSPANTRGPGDFLCDVGAECHNISLVDVHLEPAAKNWGCFYMDGTSVRDVTPAGLEDCFAQCVSGGYQVCPRNASTPPAAKLRG